MADQNVNMIFTGKDRVSGTTAGIGKSLGKLGKVAAGVALGGIALLGAGLASSVKEGMAFTKTMSNVGAVSGAVGKDFEKLTQQAKDLGSTTKFTATEAAEGMTFLAQAGFKTVDILEAMPGVLNLAAAANLDLGSSADIVSNVLSGFGAEAKETGKFVDILTKTFTTSNTDLTQLGQAMKFVAPVAKGLGLSVSATASAIGVLSNSGIQGALAGTTLRGVLSSLANPTIAASKVMKNLGFSVFDAAGRMKPLPVIMGGIADATAGMTQEQRNSTLATLVGMQRQAGFQVLLAAGETGLQKYGDLLRDSLGTAAGVAATQLDNLSGDVTLFQSAVSGLKIKTFEKLEPVLRGIARAATRFLTDGVPAITAFFSEFVKNSGFLDAMKTALQNVQSFIVGAVIPALTKLALGISENLPIAIKFLSDIWTTTLLPAMQNVQSFIVGTVIPALTKLALGVGENLPIAIQNLADFWTTTLLPALQNVKGFITDTVIPALTDLGDWVGTTLPGMIESLATSLRETFGSALAFVQQNADSFKGALAGMAIAVGAIGVVLAGAAIAAGIAAIGAAIVGLLNPVTLVIVAAAALGAAWQGNWFGIRDTLTAFWDGTAKPIFDKIVAWLGTNIPNVVGGLVSLWTDNWTTIQAVLLTAWEVIKAAVTAALDVIKPAITSFVESASGSLAKFETLLPALGDLWTALKPIVLTALGLIGAAVLAVTGVFVGMFVGVSRAIGPFIDTIVAVAEGVIEAFTGVSNFIVGFVETIEGLFTGNQEAILAGWEKMKLGIIQITEGLITAVVASITGWVETMTGLVGGLVDGFIEFFQGLSDSLVGGSIIPDMLAAIVLAFQNTPWLQLGTDAITLILEGVTNMIGSVLSTFRDLVSDAAAIFSNFDWKGIGKSIIDGVVSGISANAGKIVSKLKGIMGGAWDSITNFWQKDSPSKLTMGLGKDIMEGLVIGLGSMSAEVKRSMVANMGSNPLDAMTKNLPAPAAVSAGGGNVTTNNSTRNFNLTVNSSAPREPIIQDFNSMKSAIV